MTLYTLGALPVPSEAAQVGATPLVVAVARVTLPDEIDTEDIFVRDGSALRRSSLGRWASRLSLGVTDRLTERLGDRRPGLLVTDRPLTETPAYRVLVNVGRLDVQATGAAILDADWLVVPADARVPVTRDRRTFTERAAVVTDADVVGLVGGLVDQLAKAIVLLPDKR